MEKRVVCLDTSVLLDFFRKKNKEKTFLSRLFNQYDGIEITSITEFEIKYGINEKQSGFWEEIFSKLTILPFDSESATIAVKIHQELKKINKQIDIPDLFIAATALRYKRPLASFNKKHFERVKRLELLIPENNE